MPEQLYTVTSTIADLLDTPDNGLSIGGRDSQLLFGEVFDVAEEQDNFFYGRSLSDHYEGYMHKDLISSKVSDPTHIVAVHLAHIYPEPNFKTRPLMFLSFLSKLSLAGSQEQNGFIELPDKGWIWKNHLLDDLNNPVQTDITQTALMFLYTPYLYGGRSAFGIDCSGLVQIALHAAGIACPRDTDQQETAIGSAVDFSDPHKPDNLTMGDIVFFQNHVGLMLSEKHLLNATARHMKTVIENIDDVIKSYQGGITSVRRL